MNKKTTIQKTTISFVTALLFFAFGSNAIAKNRNDEIHFSGEMKTWHTITITFDGPFTSEYDTINPFLDYRLELEFSNGKQQMKIPGFYAADGNAAESSARAGNKWRVHFCPDTDGTWNYKVSFLKGKNIAVSDDVSFGQRCFMDGISGTFKVMPTNKTSPDFRSKGRLIYNGSRYLKHKGTGEIFLKGGTNSPENFLAYREFDGTYYGGTNKVRNAEAAPYKNLHLYSPHIIDWKEGDPYWKNGKGKGIIGGLNYLASKGMNAIYFLTLNILGDGEDVWPYNDRNERYRFDCSKLDQWEIVFSHADKLGIMLHFVLQETENQCLLDAGYVDVQRKLYLRELVARFSHHLAITWDLGEEQNQASFSPYGQTYKDTKLTADYLRKTDPYKNFITIHTHADEAQRTKDLNAYLGFKNIEGPSLQCGNIDEVHNDTKKWLKNSRDSLHTWVVCIDEIGPYWIGALPDSVDPAHDEIRKKVLWGNLMAGGAGVEWYFGSNYPNNDLSCENWRSRDKLWEQTKIAIDFFKNYLPIAEMENFDEMTPDSTDYVLAKSGQVYAIYIPDGKVTNMKLPDENFNILWYNPRVGGKLIPGVKITISGDGLFSTGNPPNADGKDWVCLIRR